MKKRFLLNLTLIVILLVASCYTSNSQTWKELMDGVKFFEEKQDYQKALQWAEKALPQAEKEYGKNDTNFVNTFINLIDLYYYFINYELAKNLSVKDSIFKIEIDKEENPIYSFTINNLVAINWDFSVFELPKFFIENDLKILKRKFDKKNIKYSLYLNRLATVYFNINKFKQSESLLKDAIKTIKETKEYHQDLFAMLLNNLGMVYRKTGKFADAEPLLDSALVIRKKILDESNPRYLESLSNLCEFYRKTNNYEKAEPLYLERLNIYKKTNKENLLNITNYLSNLAELYWKIGNNNKAIQYFSEELSIYKNCLGDTNYIYGKSLIESAAFYNDIGDFITAKKRYNEGIFIFKKYYNERHPYYLAALNNIASYYSNIAKYSDAISIYKEIYKIKQEQLGDSSNECSNLLNQLGQLDLSLGHYVEAEVELTASYKIRMKLFGDKHYSHISSLQSLIQLYERLGRYDKLEKYLKEIFSYWDTLGMDSHPYYIYFLNKLARLNEVNKNNSYAENLFLKAIELCEKQQGLDSYYYAYTLFNLGVYYLNLKEYNKSEELLFKALELYKLSSGVEHPNTASVLDQIGFLYFSTCNYNKSLDYYNKSLEIKKNTFGDENISCILTQFQLSLLYFELKNYLQSEKLTISSINKLIHFIENLFPSLSDMEKKEFWETISNYFDMFNSLGISLSKENPSIICNLYDSRIYSKALLFNSTNRIKKRILNSGDSTLIDEFKYLFEMKEFLIRTYKMTKDELKKKNINIDSLENVANELEKQITLNSEAYKQSYEKKKINWKSIQTLLKPDEAAVEVIRFKYHNKNRFTDTIYYAFLIVTEQTEEHPDIVVLENGNQLENEYYNDYRKTIKNKGKDNNSYSRYWGKLNEKLKGYKKIYFSADGIYNKLNPATLLMPDGKFLLDIQDIQQVNSTKDLLMGYYQTKQESNIYNSALLIGNPNFNLSEEEVKVASRKIRGKKDEDKSYEQIASTRGISLTKLPGTEKEISDIEKFLKSKKWEVSSYLGDNALKTAIKSANNPRVLHIATHGLFLEDVRNDSKKIFGFEEKRMIENPLLRSGLFFTGADNYLKKESSNPGDEEDNGLLTAYEAMNLDLDKTELVVLSACETGLGEIQNGEGVFGLRRAFQQAGAKTVMMSLWKVDDTATQELMSSFYKNWITGMTKREAFSKAQLEIKNKFHDPYYWGAFVMVGE